MQTGGDHPGAGDDRTLLYLHIPKVAGTTMLSVIRRNVPSDRIYEVRSEPEQAIRRFADLPEAERAQFRAIVGHFGLAMQAAVPGPSAFVTILREPVARIRSDYAYICRRPNHPKHARIVGESLGVRGVFEHELITMWDNGQTRILSGAGRSVPFGECSEDLLKRAQANIESQCAVAGTMDRFDETLILIAREFGWRKMSYLRRNSSPGRSSGPALSEEDLELIRQHNRLDSRLYEWVSSEIDSRVAALGSAFASDVVRLRRRNRVYGALASTKKRIGGRR